MKMQSWPWRSHKVTFMLKIIISVDIFHNLSINFRWKGWKLREIKPQWMELPAQINLKLWMVQQLLLTPTHNLNQIVTKPLRLNHDQRFKDVILPGCFHREFYLWILCISKRDYIIEKHLPRSIMKYIKCLFISLSSV